MSPPPPSAAFPPSPLSLTVNGAPVVYTGDPSASLLSFLRRALRLTSVKDGCSGQGACGACLVEIDGRAALACATPMARAAGTTILTLDGFPEGLRRTLARAFVNRGAVQCGFCTPGLLTRTKILLDANPDPDREEVIRAVRPHLCRCTGYLPLVDAVLDAAAALRAGREPETDGRPGVGSSWPKYGGMERALGTRPFADDLDDADFPGMLHGRLAFSEHPRARVLRLHTEEATAMPGVVRVLTAADIPGRPVTGMFVKDWPVFVAPGGLTRYIGDALACVVAETPEQARAAAAAVRADYEVLPGLFDPAEALAQTRAARPLLVDPALGGNVLLDRAIRRGPDAARSVPPGSDAWTIDGVLASCAHTASAEFSTPFVEHGFLETECCVAVPETDGARKGVRVFDQAQGLWHDREDIAAVLALPEELVTVELVDAGGGFGGKEDISVQAHAALAALLTQRPVKVKLSRPESLRMHPKRHAMRLAYTLGCDARGRLLALKARILADAGAYASVSPAVVARTGSHAAGAYAVPYVEVRVQAVYTNNIPAGAFRGFGVNQSNFAMESMMDLLADKAGLDPWRFRYDNAAAEGSLLTTGQRLGPGVALRETLRAVKPAYDRALARGRRAGLACAVKNSGIGNGLPETCDCYVLVDADGGLRLDHGWTEMGQGIHTVARQILCEAAGLDALVPVRIRSSTAASSSLRPAPHGGARAGNTTASRGSFQLGHAVLEAARALSAALGGRRPVSRADLLPLAGRVFHGRYDSAGQTTADGPPGVVRNHVSYSFATHLALLDEQGRLERIVAAHDSGTVINRALYESQVRGGVAMGLGYALSEALPLREGRLVSDRLAACGLLRATDMPQVEVIAVEKPDPEGPLGAKGLGEISAIPATAAVLNALARFSGQRCFALPLRKKEKHA